METKNIFKALADFQQEVPVIFKDTAAYSYKYADLPKILEVINPLLKKNGLGFTQLINENTLKTIIFHVESGEQIESSVNIPQGVELKGQNTFQIMGSAITYLRRYSLSAMLGLVTDKDTDAAGDQVKPSTQPTPPAEKEYMSTDHAKYQNALQAIKDGKTTVFAIEKQYVLSPEAKKELTNAQLNK